MSDRRVFVAGGGALVGLVGALAAALNGAPIPGAIAGIGVIVAAAGVFWTQPATPPTPGAAHATRATTTTDAAPSTPMFRPAPIPHVAPTPQVAPPVVVPSGDDGGSGGPAHPRLFEPAPAEPDDPIGDDDAPPVNGATPPDGTPALLTDPTTGLFSEDYFNIAIEARLAAARRHLRPVSVVLIDVVEGLRIDRVRPTDPSRVAEAVRETLREADTACRRTDGRFALLLEDTPENGAIWTVERIRRRLVDADASLTVWAGIACYPAHAFDKSSILRAADLALVAAREWRQDRIEVAAGE